MSDPERLRVRHAGDWTGALLEAVRDDAPPRGAHQRALASVGVGVGVGTAIATTTASGIAAAHHAASTGVLVWVKWVGIGMTLAVSVGGAHRLATGRWIGEPAPLRVVAPSVAAPRGVGPRNDLSPQMGASPQAGMSPQMGESPQAGALPQVDMLPPSGMSPPVGASSLVAPSPSTSALAPRLADSSAAATRPPQRAGAASTSPGGSGTNLAAHEPNPRAASEPTVAAARPAPSRLSQEVAALDAVRASLAAGNADTALGLLDAYGRSFPNGDLGPEATLLRIEGLLQVGRRSEAQKLAGEFSSANPSSPHAAKIRRLLEK